jgi:UPF0755 protein
MKRFLLLAFLLIVLAAGAAAWIFLGPATRFEGEKKALYIRTNAATKEAVLDSLLANRIITNKTAFDFLAKRLNYWRNIRPGKYDIARGSSLLTIVRMLRNGNQAPVNLVITRLRTQEDFAAFIGRRFECDSQQMMNFLRSPDSLKRFDATPETSMWRVLPDTYTYRWSASPSEIYEKINAESDRFWNEERVQKAKELGLTPLQAYILSSIVEEETSNNEEKDTIASVYLNRYRKNMYLGADPTLKFAVRDFSIKWIHGAILETESPYNTYRNKGWPPGPICTPSKRTIDEVLKAPDTDYLYFVANAHLSGHLFSTTFEEHVKKAQAYREEDKKRREQNQTIR